MLDRGAAPQGSILLWENGKIYERSTAVLRVAGKLRGGWRLLYGFIILPRFLRDGIYHFIARNRYRWFGKKDSCMVPGPGVQDRFLP